MSSCFAFFVIVLTSLALLLVFIKVLKLIKNMDEDAIEEFNEKYSKLTEDLIIINLKETSTSKLVYLWRPLNLARWLLTLLILLLL